MKYSIDDKYLTIDKERFSIETPANLYITIAMMMDNLHPKIKKLDESSKKEILKDLREREKNL